MVVTHRASQRPPENVSKNRHVSPAVNWPFSVREMVCADAVPVTVPLPATWGPLKLKVPLITPAGVVEPETVTVMSSTEVVTVKGVVVTSGPGVTGRVKVKLSVKDSLLAGS